VHEAKIYDVVYDDIGPRLLGNDINVYLSPLIEDLRKLWDKGLTCLTCIKMRHSSCVQ